MEMSWLTVTMQEVQLLAADEQQLLQFFVERRSRFHQKYCVIDGKVFYCLLCVAVPTVA